MRSRILAVVFLSVLVIGTTFFVAPVKSLSLLWEDQVPSSGLEVASPVLISGEQYTIVVSDRWWYSKPGEDNLAADVMYYTTNYTDSWDWVDNFAAPGGHSFLQIDGQDVDWGPFSNGDTNHTYTIGYTGQDAALVFRIVDWVDGNYTNNECKLLARIYGEHTVGGAIIDGDLMGTSLYFISIFAMILSVSFVTMLCDKLFARRVQRASGPKESWNSKKLFRLTNRPISNHDEEKPAAGNRRIDLNTLVGGRQFALRFFKQFQKHIRMVSNLVQLANSEKEHVAAFF